MILGTRLDKLMSNVVSMMGDPDIGDAGGVGPGAPDFGMGSVHIGNDGKIVGMGINDIGMSPTEAATNLAIFDKQNTMVNKIFRGLGEFFKSDNKDINPLLSNAQKMDMLTDKNKAAITKTGEFIRANSSNLLGNLLLSFSSPLAMATSGFMAGEDVENFINNEIANEFGKDVASNIADIVTAHFESGGDYTGKPDEILTEDNIDKILSDFKGIQQNPTVANILSQDNPDLTPKEISDKTENMTDLEKDTVVYNKWKFGNSDPTKVLTGMDQEMIPTSFQVEQHMSGKGGYDTSKSMGTPAWVKEYLSSKHTSTAGTSGTGDTGSIDIENNIDTRDFTQEISENFNSELTDIQYDHTLADISGIKLTSAELESLNQRKQIAMDKAINEIEDVFGREGETIVANQIHRLGENALTGTIGQEFINRWKEREATTKASAMQDIESSYLGAREQLLREKKDDKIHLWDKELEADIESGRQELLDKQLDMDWDKSLLLAEQARLDRQLREKMGWETVDAYDDANKWSALGGLGSAAVGSDWFGETISKWLPWGG